MDLLLLQSISLAVAEAREVDVVLRMIVCGLVDTAGLALARIWLMEHPHAEHFPERDASSSDQSRYLVLAASAGHSQVSDEEWTGLAGEFRTSPLGFRKIGQIGCDSGVALAVRSA